MKMTRFSPSTISPHRRRYIFWLSEKPIRTLNDLTEDDKTLAGHILFTAQRLALELGCEKASA
jgi:histidine triad (HIT) family protein